MPYKKTFPQFEQRISTSPMGAKFVIIFALTNQAHAALAKSLKPIDKLLKAALRQEAGKRKGGK